VVAASTACTLSSRPSSFLPPAARAPRSLAGLSPTTAASRLGHRSTGASVEGEQEMAYFPSRPEGDACDCGREYFSRRLIAGCLPNPPRLASFSNGSFGPCRVPGLLDRIVHLSHPFSSQVGTAKRRVKHPSFLCFQMSIIP